MRAPREGRHAGVGLASGILVEVGAAGASADERDVLPAREISRAENVAICVLTRFTRRALFRYSLRALAGARESSRTPGIRAAVFGFARGSVLAGARL
jgi:hypothetical protein